MSKTKKTIIIIVAVILALFLLLGSIFLILRHVGKVQFHKNDTNISADAVEIEDDDTVSYNNKKYTLNRNIVSVLFIGIDKERVSENAGFGNNGQADTLFVAAVDTSTKAVTIIPISRETMVDVNIYTKDGAYAGVEREQICLSYAYGDTPQSSSENVLTSVKRLMYGVNINSYVTMDLEGIEKFTTLLGGVRVTSLENVWYKGSFLYEGQSYNLKGDMATSYIQYRNKDISANDRRMQRQKQFLSALATTAGNSIMNDFTKLSSYYSTLSPYFSTNVSLAQVTYLASNCLTMNIGDALQYKSIEGTLTQDGKWVEFEADKESVLQTVIDTFYIEKQQSTDK